MLVITTGHNTHYLFHLCDMTAAGTHNMHVCSIQEMEWLVGGQLRLGLSQLVGLVVSDTDDDDYDVCGTDRARDWGMLPPE